jgi:predicted transposase
LAFDKDGDKEKVLNLMQKFSSMVRFTYKRLLEGVEKKRTKKASFPKIWNKHTVFG